jgi:hypothetical protein
MGLPLPAVRVGAPLQHRALVVFPLFAPPQSAAEYLLAAEALRTQMLKVEEVGEQGHVPELFVDNQSCHRVLFLEGEELVGAKQNRVLNASLFVPAQTRLKIPVSCVEQGRWRHVSRTFSHGEKMASSPLRAVLKKSVTESLHRQGSHSSDQSAVWSEVSRQQESLNTASTTMAMSDTFAAHASSVEEFKEKVPYVEGAVGLAAAVGGKLVLLDLFDQPATCRQVWPRLLAGLTMDALEAQANAPTAEPGHVEALLQQTQQAAWEPGQAVGEGRELRLSHEQQQGSVLLFNDQVVHLSIVAM